MLGHRRSLGGERAGVRGFPLPGTGERDLFGGSFNPNGDLAARGFAGLYYRGAKPQEVARSMLTERIMIQRLQREGIPVVEIARRLGCSRQTVYNRLEEVEASPPTPRASKLDQFRAYIESRLEQFELPATTLMAELRKQGYKGGISILRDFVASIKEGNTKRIVQRFETEPGRQAQVDWGSCGTIIHQGKRQRLSLLVVVLGHSRMIWARFVVSERRPVLITLLEAAFHAFGGVPRELLFDNLKAVVARPRTEKRKAEIQAAFASFATHWGFEVVACPPYWPRAKGKVERGVGYIKQSFLEGRSVETLEDLNAQLALWLDTVANVRLHGTTKVRPIDQLEAEREAMLPLVATCFPSACTYDRQVDHDGFFSFRGVRYSVDPEILTGRRGLPIEVHLGTDERIRCIHRGRLVGEHRRAPSGSPAQDDRLHAAARQRLRQRPPKTDQSDQSRSRFEQIVAMATLPPAPQVAVRSLAEYNLQGAVACSPN